MKRLFFAISFLIFYSGLNGQCYPVFKKLNTVTPFYNSEAIDRNFPYYYRYSISSYKNSDSSYMNFGYHNGSSWTNLNGQVIEGYTYRLLKWGNKIITTGIFRRINQIKAPTKKYFAALEYKNGRWDTIPGCTFDSAVYVEMCSSSTDLFARIPNSSNNGGSVYQYDTGSKSFSKIVDYQTYTYNHTTLLAGTDRVVLTNVHSVNGTNTNGFAYFENNSVYLCSSANFNENQDYCIDKITDHIYSMYLVSDPTVYEYSNTALTPRKTHVKFVGAYSPLHVGNGQMIFWSYGTDSRDNYYHVLCSGDTNWKTIQNLKFSGYSMTNPYCAINGTYCERFGNGSSATLKLENGSLLSGKAFIDKDSNCNLDSTDIQLKKYMVFAEGNSFLTSTQTDDSGHYEMFIGADTLKIYGSGKISSCAGTNSIITSNSNIYSKNVPIKDPGAYDVKAKINVQSIIRWNDIGLYAMEIENNGYPVDSVNLTFDSDPKVQINSTDSNFYTYNDTQALGRLYNLDYYEKRWVYVSAWIDTAKSKPDSILCHRISASITPAESDYSNNSDEDCQLVVYSYDPNHKSCNVKKAKPDIVTRLEYTIEFQNEGKGDAIDVVVVDALSNKLNGKTLKITGSSHPYTIQYNEGQIRLTFKNINLKPKSVDEAGSKGYFSYSIDTKSGLQNGDSIMNNAYIYFDLNAPVITEWCVVHIDKNVTRINKVDHKVESLVYPNPVNQFLNIRVVEDRHFKFIDSYGRVVMEGEVSSGENTLDLNELSSGIYNLIIGDEVIRIIKL